ncbi:HECT E3 ubiquitin ligase, partial [Thraustotheca clavata]
MIRFLIQKGADIHPKVLHAAALARRCDVVSFLLQHGANPNALDDQGRTVYQAVTEDKRDGVNAVEKLLTLFETQRDESDEPHSSSSSHRMSRDWMMEEGQDESEHDYDSHQEEEDSYEGSGMEDEMEDVDMETSATEDDRERTVSMDSAIYDESVVIPEHDIGIFTKNLLETLLELCPSINNKVIAHTILSTICNILATNVTLNFIQTTKMLEIVQGLLMEQGDSASVGSFVLALRLLYAMSRMQQTEVVVQMERQGIIAHLQATATSNPDSTLAYLAREWLDDLRTWYTQDALSPSIGVLNKLDEACRANDLTGILEILGVENGVTTFEFTKSNAVNTILSIILTQKHPWHPSMVNLVHHLHQAIGLHESFPIISYGLTKGKELYPLTRQLRCRLRLPPNRVSVANMPPRSIHASPLTLFSSFERTAFRCATITDQKWTTYAWNLVGQSIWRQVDGKWVECRVCGFDPSSSCHLINMRDEFLEEVLHEEQYRLVKVPLEVHNEVTTNLESFGQSPNLKRKANDDDAKGTRRSKRTKKRSKHGSVDDDEDDEDEARDVDMTSDHSPNDARSKRKRLLDLLKYDQPLLSTNSERVWIKSPHTDICINALVSKRIGKGQLQVEASFGTDPKVVVLTVDESSLIDYQPKARPGSTASKVNRMMGALESQFRQGGRPMLDHLRRLLSRSRDDEASEETSSSPQTAPNKKGKAKNCIKPKVSYNGEVWTCSAPPKVRCLLGYGEYSDKGFDEGAPSHPLQSMVLSMNQRSLLPHAAPVFVWLFDEFASGRHPTRKPANLPRTSDKKLGLDDFSAFLKAANLTMTATEEWICFSQYASADWHRSFLNSTGFCNFVAHLCRDTRRCKYLGSYLEILGFSEKTFESTAAKSPASISLANFAPDDNLLSCLSRLKPTATDSSIPPWKCIYSLYCDFDITWSSNSPKESPSIEIQTPWKYQDVITHQSSVPAQSTELDQAL